MMDTGALKGSGPAERRESGSKLELSSIRAALIRQEDTIIFALIERSQWLRNAACYDPAAPAYRELLGGAGGDLSFLDYMLCETERLHARVRRYSSPDEYAFFADRLPPPDLPLLSFPSILHPSCVNLNEQIKAVYLNRVLPGLCGEGDDEQHGSSVVADVAVLQAISKRVHYGLFVAESKFQAQTEEYTALIRAGDEKAIMALLTNSAVEDKVLRRVRRKASLFGGDVEADEATPAAEASKVDPEVIVSLYREFVIPLTKEAEVQYLLQRLGAPVVACAGGADGAAHRAARRAFAPDGGAHKPAVPITPRPAVAAVFEAVMGNKAHFGVVPLETGEGGVHPTTRTLLWRWGGGAPLVITGEVIEDVSYRISSRVPLAQVRTVCGRQQTLRRCTPWLQTKLASSTSYVFLDDEGAPPWEGRLDGAEHAATAFVHTQGEAPPPGCTESAEVGGALGGMLRDRLTFVTIAKRADVGGPPCGADKSMALFSLGDEAGGLATALSAFHRHGVNLTFIQSYRDELPAPAAGAADAAGGAGAVGGAAAAEEPGYVFLVQFQGHVADANVAAAVDELRGVAGKLRLLGSYLPSA